MTETDDESSPLMIPTWINRRMLLKLNVNNLAHLFVGKTILYLPTVKN